MPQVSSIDYHPEETRRARPVAFLVASVVCALAAVILAFLAYGRNSALADARAQLNHANAESAQARAEVATANAQTADLRTQLDRARSQQADVQAQLAQAQGLRTDLQAKLARAQSDLQAQAGKDQAQLASTQQDLQNQLKQARDESAGLRTSLDQANSQTADLKAQLAKAQGDVAQLQPLAQRAQVLPITTGFKKSSFWGKDYTLELKSLQGSPLNVTITITGSPKSPSRSATLAGGGSLEVSDVAPGAQVVVASDGFNPVNLTAH